MTELNENHKKNLLITFQHLDKILSEFECLLDVVIPRCALQHYVNDLDPDLRKAIEKSCDHLRKTMCRILEGKNIHADKPQRSVLNQIKVTLIFADMAIEELLPKHMKGYGQLSEAAENELNAMVAQLKDLIREISDKLPKS